MPRKLTFLWCICLHRMKLLTDYVTDSVWLFLCPKEKPQFVEGLAFTLTKTMVHQALELSQQRAGAAGCFLHPLFCKARVPCLELLLSVGHYHIFVAEMFYIPDTHNMPFCVFNGMEREIG